jgi:hypothetical protein
MTTSSCVTKLGPGVGAYNSVVGSKHLCEALKNAGISMPCPPSPELLDELDKKILCAIFCCCLEEPNITSVGHKRYQNCVAATLRLGQAGDVNAPAYRMNPEVSYNMNTVPPTPVGRNFDPASLADATKAAYEAATGRRRPDIVIRNGYGGGLSGGNIGKVYEMKFPGDQYGPGQEADYKSIANGNLETLDEKTCCKGKDKEGKRLLESSYDAVTKAQSDFLNKVGGAALGGLGGRILGGLGGLLGGRGIPVPVGP